MAENIENYKSILFPGQGSQKLGMLSELAQEFDEIKSYFNRASEVLGEDLWEIAQANQSKLNMTEYTQPAILTASVVLWDILNQQNIIQKNQIKVMAGHSLGEYSALVCANALSFEAGVKLVSQRGKLMQSAVPENMGVMIALIGLEDSKVEELTQKISTDQHQLVAANYNAPGQVVVAGDRVLADQFVEMAKSAGAKRAIILPMSVPSHCPLLKEAAEKFESDLNNIDWSMPDIAVIQNATGKSPENIDALKNALKAQLYSPVPWVKTVNSIILEYKINDFIECGPGQVLSGLMKRINRDVTIQSAEKLLIA